MPEITYSETMSFWQLNYKKIGNLFLTAILLSFVFLIFVTVIAYFSRWEYFSIWILILSALGTGIFIAFIVTCYSWYSFGRINKSILKFYAGDDKDFDNLRYIFTDNDNSLDFFKLCIRGYYKKKEFIVHYFASYSETESDSYQPDGIYIRIVDIYTPASNTVDPVFGNVQHAKYLSRFFPCEKLKKYMRIDLKEQLSRLLPD